MATPPQVWGSSCGPAHLPIYQFLPTRVPTFLSSIPSLLYHLSASILVPSEALTLRPRYRQADIANQMVGLLCGIKEGCPHLGEPVSTGRSHWKVVRCPLVSLHSTIVLVGSYGHLHCVTRSQE